MIPLALISVKCWMALSMLVSMTAGDTAYVELWQPESADLINNPTKALYLLNESSDAWQWSLVFQEWSTAKSTADVSFYVPLKQQDQNSSVIATTNATSSSASHFTCVMVVFLIRTDRIDEYALNSPKFRIEVPGQSLHLRPFKQKIFWVDNRLLWKLFLIRVPIGSDMIRFRGVGAVANRRVLLADLFIDRRDEKRRLGNYFQYYVEAYGMSSTTTAPDAFIDKKNYNYDDYDDTVYGPSRDVDYYERALIAKKLADSATTTVAAVRPSLSTVLAGFHVNTTTIRAIRITGNETVINKANNNSTTARIHLSTAFNLNLTTVVRLYNSTTERPRTLLNVTSFPLVVAKSNTTTLGPTTSNITRSPDRDNRSSEFEFQSLNFTTASFVAATSPVIGTFHLPFISNNVTLGITTAISPSMTMNFSVKSAKLLSDFAEKLNDTTFQHSNVDEREHENATSASNNSNGTTTVITSTSAPRNQDPSPTTTISSSSNSSSHFETELSLTLTMAGTTVENSSTTLVAAEFKTRAAAIEGAGDKVIGGLTINPSNKGEGSDSTTVAATTNLLTSVKPMIAVGNIHFKNLIRHQQNKKPQELSDDDGEKFDDQTAPSELNQNSFNNKSIIVPKLAPLADGVTFDERGRRKNEPNESSSFAVVLPLSPLSQPTPPPRQLLLSASLSAQRFAAKSNEKSAAGFANSNSNKLPKPMVADLLRKIVFPTATTCLLILVATLFVIWRLSGSPRSFYQIALLMAEDNGSNSGVYAVGDDESYTTTNEIIDDNNSVSNSEILIIHQPSSVQRILLAGLQPKAMALLGGLVLLALGLAVSISIAYNSTPWTPNRMSLIAVTVAICAASSVTLAVTIATIYHRLVSSLINRN